MYDTILVPTDGSEPADAAIEMALALADRFDASLRAINVVEFARLSKEVEGGTSRRITELAEPILASITERAADRGVSVSTDIVETTDAVHRAIVDDADDHDADLVVMGTHGRTGLDRIALGSVTERTLRVSPVPVLTVSDDASADPGLDSVLVATDGSDGANAAADHAIALCAATGAALRVVHVVNLTPLWGSAGSAAILDALEEFGQRAVDDVIRRAEAAGVRSTEASVLSGTPARGIVDDADDHDVDLIVMGTHGRTGLDRYLLGSVTEHVVRLSDRPVLTLRAPNDD
ncbi:universal stress protein [Halomicrobium salinisoli]|uniref:universal stress protein n=1 Tax=Halomicrobium salinisoli TaxID=2878391 RepID=UPI001CF0C4E1|nr:universal stress protein [Halomicrobium salinisoli]